MNSIIKINGKIKIIQLLARLIIPVGILYIICILNQKNLVYVDTLVRPLIMPKSYILGIINGIIFIITGFASYRIFMINYTGTNIKNSLFYYYIQILTNYLWMYSFISFRLYGISFIIMVILTIIGIITFVKFIKHDKLAGKLFLISIIYNLFLCYTNFSIWMYNEM